MSLAPMVVQMTVAESVQQINMDIDEIEDVVFGVGTEIRTVHVDGHKLYADLPDKPCINEHQLRSGNNNLIDIGIGLATNLAINNLFN